jgi:hypothetical protein
MAWRVALDPDPENSGARVLDREIEGESILIMRRHGLETLAFEEPPNLLNEAINFAVRAPFVCSPDCRSNNEVSAVLRSPSLTFPA